MLSRASTVASTRKKIPESGKLTVVFTLVSSSPVSESMSTSLVARTAARLMGSAPTLSLPVIVVAVDPGT